jgi:hypothetical protein
MNLPAHSIVEPGRTGVNESTRWFVALVCAASAGVHAALVPEHFAERPLLGGAFALSVVLLGAGAVRMNVDPAAAPWVAGVLMGVAGCYLLSRTTGLPLLIPHPEPVDVVGVLTTLAEVVAGLAALSLPRFGKERR